MTAFARRDFPGAATATTLASSMSSTDTTMTITSDTGWPGSPGHNFFVVIDRDLAAEEKVLCSANSGTTVAIAARGQDGTTGVAHNQNATVEICWSGVDADESNQVSNLMGNMALGSLPVGNGSGTLALELPVGSNGQVLTADSTKAHGVAWESAAIGNASASAAGVVEIAANPASGTPVAANVLADQKEVTITTANTWQTIATFTPSATGSFSVGVVIEVASGTPTVGIQVTLADANGAQTYTIVPTGTALSSGQWSPPNASIVAHSGTAINVQVQASTTSNITASAKIKGD